MAYTIIAKNNTDLGAWPFVVRASYWCGLAEGLYVKEHGSPFAGHAAKGGAAKAEKVQPLKDEVIRHLQMPPSEGWGPVKTTAYEITQRLKIFLESNKFYEKKFPVLEDTISRWIKGDNGNSAIKDAYISNKKTKL